MPVSSGKNHAMVRQMTYGLRTGMIYEKAGAINHQVLEGNRETVYG